MENKRLLYIVFGFLMMTSLLSGVWTGLIRVGLNLPFTNGMTNHGAIFVCSFAFTLIFFKTISDTGKKMFLLIPISNAFSIIPLLMHWNGLAFILLTLTSIAFAVFLFSEFNSFRNTKSVIFLLGILCLIVGNFKLYLTGFYPVAVPLWMGAILLVIFSENIHNSFENSRFKIVWLIISVILTVTLFIPFHSGGEYILGIIFIIFSILIPVTLLIEYKKLHALPVYFKAGFLASYFFLLLTGVLYVWGTKSAYHYDAAVHSFFLGFLFTMIFTDIGSERCLSNSNQNSFNKKYFIYYLWMFILISSLLVRIYADVEMNIPLRIFTAKFNGVAVIGFFITHILVHIKKPDHINIKS